VFLCFTVDTAPHMLRLLAATALVLAAAPATAGAATWTEPPAPCYVSVNAAERELVPINADGFTPNARVDVTLDGAPADANGDGVAEDVYADSAGRVRGSVPAPYQPSGERTFGVLLTERANPANAASMTVKVTALAVRLSPDPAPSSARVRFRGRGFRKPAAVWAHYLYGGKLRRTVRLEKPRGECGTFDLRRRQIPIVRPRVGRWVLQVDQQKAYSPRPDSVSVRLTIDVSVRVKASARSDVPRNPNLGGS
jgi:hypothetical protein